MFYTETQNASVKVVRHNNVLWRYLGVICVEIRFKVKLTQIKKVFSKGIYDKKKRDGAFSFTPR